MFDKRLPLTLAIFLTYVLGAYVLIPAAIRLARIFFPASHLPLYCVTPDGFASDPLNVAIIGSKSQLIKAMQTTGWYVADDHSLRNIIHEVISGIFNRSYPTAPMSNLYLFGRKQDIGFEIPIPGERGQRHHVRFWATTYDPDGNLSADKSLGRPSQHCQRQKYSLDRRCVARRWLRHYPAQCAGHAYDLSRYRHERNKIVNALDDAGKLQSIHDVRLGSPYSLRNRAFGGHLRTDGLLRVAKLKD